MKIGLKGHLFVDNTITPNKFNLTGYTPTNDYDLATVSSVQNAINTSGSGFPNVYTLTGSSTNILLTFDQNKNYKPITQTGNTSLSANTLNTIEGSNILLIIDGISGYTLTIPTTWINGNGIVFDSTKRNRIFIQYSSGEFIYTIIKSAIPIGSDITPPIYNLQTILNITNINSVFNVQINENGYIKYLLKNTNSIPTKSDILNGINSFNNNYGSLNMVGNATNAVTLTGLTASTQYYLWSYAIDTSLNETSIQSGITFTTSSGSSTFFNTKSLSVGAGNQIPTSPNNPPALSFGNGTTDFDFTISFDMKINGVSGNQFIIFFGKNDTSINAYQIYLNSSGSLVFNVLKDSLNNDYITSSPIPTSVHNRFVCRYQASTKTMDMYMNGALLSSSLTHVGSYSLMAVPDSTWAFCVGGAFGYVPATNLLLDNLLVMNKRITTTEITELYNGGVPKDPTILSFSSNIKLDLRFENNLNDNSSSSYNFTSIATPTYSTDHI